MYPTELEYNEIALQFFRLESDEWKTGFPSKHTFVKSFYQYLKQGKHQGIAHIPSDDIDMMQASYIASILTEIGYLERVVDPNHDPMSNYPKEIYHSITIEGTEYLSKK
jgi:hypothetical protein